MGLRDSIRGEFIDIIEYPDMRADVLSYRFERHENEIKMNAKLVVREGQAAFFVNEGRLADIFEPGTHTLGTKNLPVLATLKGWKYAFDSPYKAEVYFLNRLVFAERKWGTPHPVLARDPELGGVRLRAFGYYTYRIENPRLFFERFVGAKPMVRAEELDGQLRAMVAACFAEAVGGFRLGVFDLTARVQEVGAAMAKEAREEFGELGLSMHQCVIESISLPAEVERLLDRKAGMAAIGDTQDYLRFNVADAVGEALKADGGLAGALAGAGLGLGIGQQIAGQVPGWGAGVGTHSGNDAGSGTGSGFAPGAGPAAGSAGSLVPPPLPLRYFVEESGASTGPFLLEEIEEKARTGLVTAASLLWKTGAPGWARAASLPEVARMLEGGGDAARREKDR